MKEFRYTKSLGTIVGVLTILGACGFGFLAFIGLGLSKALNGGHNTSSDEVYASNLFIILAMIYGKMRIFVRMGKKVCH